MGLVQDYAAGAALFKESTGVGTGKVELVGILEGGIALFRPQCADQCRLSRLPGAGQAYNRIMGCSPLQGWLQVSLYHIKSIVCLYKSINRITDLYKYCLG